MTPTELAEVREACERVGVQQAEATATGAMELCDENDRLILLGAFTDFLMRRECGVRITKVKHYCLVGSPRELTYLADIVHPNPLVALARAVNATEASE